MFNPYTGTKFEVSTATCNEDLKGNAKCKNSRFEPPFGGLRGDWGKGDIRGKSDTAVCRQPVAYAAPL